MKYNFKKVRTSLLAMSLIFVMTACGQGNSEEGFSLSDWREVIRLEWNALMERIGFGPDGKDDSSSTDSGLFGGFNINPDISVEVHEQDPDPSSDGEEIEARAEGLTGFYYDYAMAAPFNP